MKILGYILTVLPLLLAAYTIQPRVLLVQWGVSIVMLAALHVAQAKLPAHWRPPSALYPGLAIGLAVVVVVHQTAGYFDTGATGASMAELLLSYRMWGFHPNWRTVLFSTIMMVVLITWPRKFKKLHKIIPAGFVGVLLTTGLNILLYPDASRVIIPELFWRIPVSSLAMLLIFTAWQHVPYASVAEIFCRRKWVTMAVMFVIVGAMFWFNPLWVVVACIPTWGLSCKGREYCKK